MIVINASPAIHLHAVLPGGLARLAQLYGEVIMPQEVFSELQAGGTKDNTAADLLITHGIAIRNRPVRLSGWLQNELDLGEAAVIQTAMDEGGATVILDDRKGRRVARRMGLPVTGTLGILLQAKKAGHLPNVDLAISKLVHRGMWIDEDLRRSVLKAAGEAS